MHSFESVAALESLLESGEFEENHYLEAKEVLPLGSKGKNIELARDLAQFAIDGGALVFGVAEDKQERSFSLAPIPLESGLVEQVEQIAQTRCEPPLSVQARALPAHEGDPRLGYLVVSVPPSTRAPHMVDGKYPARGNATRQFLSDAEVRALVGQTEDVKGRTRTTLEDWVNSDPYTDGSPRTAHLFGVAVPLAYRVEQLVSKQEAQQLFWDAQGAYLDRFQNRWPQADQRTHWQAASNWQILHHLHPRADSWAIRTEPLQEYASNGTPPQHEHYLAEWSISNPGVIRLYDAGLSDHRESPQGDVVHAAWPRHAVDFAALLVESAHLWAKQNEYRGEWGFGLAATGMHGARTEPMNLYRSTVADRDRAGTVQVVSGHDLATNPNPTVDTLARGVLATYGETHWIEP